MNKIKVLILGMALCGVTFAGENELTIHSRAGCPMPNGGFLNESVNWDGSGKVRHHMIRSFHGGWVVSELGTIPFRYMHAKFANGYEVPMSRWNAWVRDNEPFDTKFGRTGSWAEASDDDKHSIDKKYNPKYYFKVDAAHLSIEDGVKSFHGTTVTDQCPPNDWSKIKSSSSLRMSSERKISYESYIPRKKEVLNGIHILPMNEIYSSYPEIKKSNVIFDKSENPFRDKLLKFKNEGFSYYRSEPVIKKSPLTSLQSYKEVPIETDMKPRHELIDLAFQYNGIPNQDKNKVIGYAPAISQIDGKWNGIGSYFTNPDLGSCHYVIYNIKLSGGGAELPAELISYDVNNKPTIMKTVVNEKRESVYTINWYDNTFIHILDCARDYDENLSEKLISLARILDKEAQ